MNDTFIDEKNMDGEKITRKTISLKNNKVEWLRDIWNICERKYKELLLYAKGQGFNYEGNNDVCVIYLYYQVYNFIMLEGIVDNKYITITPNVLPKDLFKEYKGKRNVTLDYEMVESLVDSLLLLSFQLFKNNRSNLNKEEELISLATILKVDFNEINSGIESINKEISYFYSNNIKSVKSKILERVVTLYDRLNDQHHLNIPLNAFAGSIYKFITHKEKWNRERFLNGLYHYSNTEHRPKK
jgi:hypothetical protein